MKNFTGAQGAVIVRLLIESYRAKAHRILEAGFTGQKKDKLGHTRYYQNGRQVKNPNAKEKSAIHAAASQSLPAGQAPSHNDAETRVDALHADTPPEHVAALANDLMKMSVEDLTKMAKAPAEEEPKQKRANAGGEVGPNGEHYKGGAYIATTEMPKAIKDKIKRAAGDGMVKVTDPETGKTTRETPPSPDLMSISASMIGTFIGPRGDVNHNYLDALEDRGASYDLRTKVNDLARKYQAGEKWVSINDFPEVAKGEDIYRLAAASLPIHPDLLNRMPEEFRNYYTLQKSKADLKNDKARGDFDKIQIGDKFKDKTGKEYVIHKKGAGTVRAWPLVNGEPKVGNEKKFAITDSAKEFNPDHEKSVSLDDFAPAPKEEPAVKPTPTETKAAAAAEKATDSGEQKGIGEAGELLSLDTAAIKVDPTRFQYKQKLDSTTGAGDNLKNVSKFNSLFAGVVHAWKDPADGQVYVVNGHHRMELANRAGHKKMNVQMIIAPSASVARSTGALINMAEGRGTALDAAKFLRESGQTVEDIKGHGVSLKEKVVDEAMQLKDLSDRIFNDLSTGLIETDKAVAIGRHLKDHKQQEQLYNHYLEQKDKTNKDFNAATLAQAAIDISRTPTKSGGGQMDLFGNNDEGKSLFLEKAELKTKIRNMLTQEVNDYAMAGNARRAKNIAGAGNVLQVDKNKDLSKEADRIKQAYEQFQHLSGPLSDAINASVEEYANAKGSKKAIVEKTLAAVRSAIHEIVDGTNKNDVRASSQNPQDDQGTGGTRQADLPGDVRGGNAQDVGPSLFGEPQDDEAKPADAAKADEPGFTGIDSQGREWRNGELVAAKDDEPAAEPAKNTPPSPRAQLLSGVSSTAKANGKRTLEKTGKLPHELTLNEFSAVVDPQNAKWQNGQDPSQEHLEFVKSAMVHEPEKVPTSVLQMYADKDASISNELQNRNNEKPSPAAIAKIMGPEALALDALRLKGNKKPHNAAHLTADALLSLKAQGFVDDNAKLTNDGRAYLYLQKGKTLRKATGPKVKPAAPAQAAPQAAPQAEAPAAPPAEPAKKAPTGGEKYFGVGGGNVAVTLRNGKKGIIPPPMEVVPGWKEYEEQNYPNGPIPPKSFYNLSEAEATEHREAQELIRREWVTFRQDYLAKNGTFDPDSGELISITLNCDDWRDQFPTYVGTNSGTIHDAASYANMRMLNEAMALMKGKGNNQFLVLGGGGGSGKGTATKDIIKASDYPVVLDSVSDDSAWTKELMDMAKGHGYGGQFVFIDRAPQDAWKDGVVKRAMESREKFNAGDKTSLARTVPLSVALPANLKARRAAFELLEDGTVPTMIINNNLGFGKAREVETKEAGAYLQTGMNGYNKEQLLKEMEDDTYGLYESGKIPDDIAKGLISAKTIAARRIQPRPTGGSDREGPPDGRGTNTDSQGASNQAPVDGSTSQGTSGAGKSGQGEEVEKDFSKQQEIKNSLDQGEGIIKYGKKTSGEKYSTDELNAVIKSVNKERAKLGQLGFTGIDAQGREWRNGELVAAKDEPAAQAKEPWEISQGEAVAAMREKAVKMHGEKWAADHIDRQTTSDLLGQIKRNHRGDVQNAIDAGKKVDPSVLADYPDIQAAAAKPAPAPAEPAQAGTDEHDDDRSMPEHEAVRQVYLMDLPKTTTDQVLRRLNVNLQFRRKTGKISGSNAYTQYDIKLALEEVLTHKQTSRQFDIKLNQAEKSQDPKVQSLIKERDDEYENLAQLKEKRGYYGAKWAEDQTKREILDSKINIRKLNQKIIDDATEPAPAAPAGNTDLFGNPSKATAPKGPETMPGLFGDAVPIAPDAPAAAAGEPLPGSDNPLDRAGAGRGRQDATQDMFGLFGPATKNKIDQVNNGPGEADSTPAAKNQSLPHEMNWSEYKQSRIEKLSPEQQAKWAEQDNRDFKVAAKSSVENQWGEEHKAFIKRAQDEGQTVPGKVYDDYPSLNNESPKALSAKAPGVSLSDVPYDLAFNAHRGTSFDPEKRASYRQQSYVNQMQADWEHLSQFAKTPQQQEILKSEFARYKAGYLGRTKAQLSADSRILSPMISGPARFPTNRNNKANSASEKRQEETVEFRKRALFAAAKAINPVTSGAPVLSRDDDAVQTLTTQVAALERIQDHYKKINAAYAKFLKNPASLATSGLSEKEQATVKAFHEGPKDRGDSSKPYPSYRLTNNGASIRRIHARIEDLSKLKAMPEKEEKYSGGVSINHDPDDARIRIKFPGKPSPEVIKQIKSRGFIWSPTHGTWQRQLNRNGEYAADELMKALGHEKTTTEAVMPATDPHAAKIKLIQAIIARRGLKPPQPKAQAKKIPEASEDADPRVKRIRELMDAYC